MSAAADIALNGTPAVPCSRPDAAANADADVAQLTRALARGDEPAFRDFHARYFDRVYHFLLVLTRGNEHAARDALQETLLRVARYVRTFEAEDVFWCWLRAVARSAARDGERKRRRYAGLLERFSLAWGGTQMVDAWHQGDRVRELLAEELANMPPADRALLEGKYIDGRTVAELVAQTGTTEKALESRLLRARRSLAGRLLKKLKLS